MDSTPAFMPEYRQIVQETWVSRGHALHIQGLEGGSLAYALQRLPLLLPDTPSLIICPTSKLAARLLDDIQAIAAASGPTPPLHLFPAPDHLPYHPLTPSRDTWVARLRILNEWTRRTVSCVVAPVTALLRRLPPADFFTAIGDTIHVGSAMDMSEMQHSLVAMGYAAAPLVEEPGDFSRRGGILDIWSLAESQPCRIELDGDVIASIRYFDPETQRSRADLGALTIIPAHNLCFEAGDLPAITRRIKSAADAADFPANKRRALVEALQQGRRLPVMETLLPCFYEQTSSVADYLSPKTRIIIVDPAGIRGEAENYWETCRKAHAETEDIDRIIPPDALFVPWAALRATFPKSVCTIGGIAPTVRGESEKPVRGELDEPQFSPSTGSGRTELITVDTHSTASSRMDTLEPLLKRLRDSGLSLTLTSATPIQAERLSDMLRWSRGAGSRFAGQDTAPVAIQGPLFAEPLKPGQIRVAVSPLSAGFDWPAEGVICITEEELLGRKASRRPKPSRPVENFVSFSDLAEGNPLVHVEHGIGRYIGLTHMQIQNHASDFLILEYLGGDKLYLPVYRMNLVQRYIGADDSTPGLDKLGGTRFTAAKKRAETSIRAIANDLLKIYAARKLHQGFAFGPRNAALETFEAAFPFEETPDQWEAIEAVLGDMQKNEPMDRLICGDVGFGKTEIAMRAAYRAALDGRQVAVLVPTTLLAFQHYQTFQQRFKDTGVRIEYVSRFVSRSDQKQILADVAAGTVDILIGTHRLLQSDVQMKRMGLLVIDEEHRFGVSQKEKIRELKATVDTLAMSATPIPRTLHMSLSGLRDISVIRTPPVDRQSIRTYIAPFEDRLIHEVVQKEMARGGQFFFVHNRVETIYNMVDHLRRILPDVRIAVGHGQMAEHELEKSMLAFTRKECDGLLCTSIIESGIDIPSANTILVNRADTFGLSQLYQIRGRVGRSNLQAYAYLLTAADRELTEIAEKRLEALQRHTELGSGFSIAMHDLEIRGGGNLLGAQQSGHIHDIGYEMFTQLLEQVITELREAAFNQPHSGVEGGSHTALPGGGATRAPVIDPEITLPISAFLPADYVSDAQLRLVCYKQLSGVEDAAALDALAAAWMDRFGPLPETAQNLLQMMEVKLLAKTARVEQLQYDGNYLNLRLHETTTISRDRILKWVQKEPDIYQIRPNSTLRITLPGLSGKPLFTAIRRVFETLCSR